MEVDVTPPQADVQPVRAPVDDPPALATKAEDRPVSGKRPIHWLLEGVFIVVSVVLGFSLTEFGEYRNDRALAGRMVAGIRLEVEYNRAALAPFVPIHRAWQQALETDDPSSGTGSAIDVLFATRPTLPPEFRTNVPLLRRAAWDTALSTGALRLVDYDLAASLSEIYGMQDYAAATFPKMFSDPSFFDPAARSATLRLAQTTMRELVFAEETLVALYDQHLPAIRTAAGDH